MNNYLEVAVNEYINSFTGICELVKKYNVSSKSIRNKLENLGYKIANGASPRSVVNIKKAVDYYKECINLNIEPNIFKISKDFGVSHSTITTHLKNENINIVKYPKINQFDEHVFDLIDTEEKAYWLGFLSADGYVCKRYNTFGVGLSYSDIDHLEKFSKFLKYDGIIKVKTVLLKTTNKTYKVCKIEIGNKHLKDTLLKYGFSEKKSSELKFIEDKYFSDKNLIKHYIRGYFDGDGSLGIYKKYYKSNKTNQCLIKKLSFCGLDTFMREIIVNLGISAKICYTNNKASWFSSISFSGKNAFNIANYLYKDANIYLDRKYKIYKDFCRSDKELLEKLSTNIGELCDENTEITSEITKGSEAS